ncbi:MAG: phosphate ABC transporter permease PstA [Anaerolineae bacterium]|nr:phosphate ABC transporter permease PstA [Anaerolineae bacterium]
MGNVTNRIFGLIAIRDAVPPSQLSDRPLEELNAAELTDILAANLQGGARTYILDQLIGRDRFNANREAPLRDLITGVTVPEEFADKKLTDLTQDEAKVLVAQVVEPAALLDSIYQDVVGREVLESWPLTTSLFDRASIEAKVINTPEWEGAQLEWRSWLNPTFLLTRMNITAIESGVRTALLGSLLVIALTVVIAFPLGVGTAVYLEEYSKGDNWLERLIETNIRNLAGVPSIIYGLLGLAIFVRALEAVTQGRSVISAALTMALLILPIIIINAQEALRAVPPSIREASFGLGATRWQTIWNQVLPAAMPGILTGTILGLSRAIGETAPLIVVGAATFIATDPTVTSKFTVIPIQIYNWVRDPREGFGEIAAAAIVLLLIVLLIFNAAAIILRQRFRKNLQG